MPSISRRLTISVNSILRIERDSSTRARRIFHRARRYFRFSAFGTSPYFSSSFLTPSSCTRTLIDLLQELALPRRDLLVGDLFLVEDDQLAHGALAALELLAHLDDFLRDLRRARDRLDDRELALLDALRDRHLALAGEQRHRAHLAQVHADRVVGLVERARREVEVALLAALALQLVVAVGLLGVDDLDAGAAERAEQIVQLLGRRDVGGQQLVDLVVEEVALLLADA